MTERSVLEPFLQIEYEQLSESLMRNEEGGEKRVTFFLTLTSGVLAILGLLVRKDGGGLDIEMVQKSRSLIASVLLFPLGIGWFTFVRLLHRNVATDRYKLALRALRRHLISPRTARTVSNAFFNLYDPFEVRRTSLLPFARGGWLEVVALVNAMLAGAFGAILALRTLAEPDGPRPYTGWSGVAVLVAMVWLVQMWFAQRIYRAKTQTEIARDEAEREARIASTEP